MAVVAIVGLYLSIRDLTLLPLPAYPAVLRSFSAAFRARNQLSADIALHLASVVRFYTVFQEMRSPPEPFPALIPVPPYALTRSGGILER